MADDGGDTAVWRMTRDGGPWLRMAADGPQAQVSFELVGKSAAPPTR